MLGDIKTMRLCLSEYLVTLAFHVIYAFYKFGSETGRLTLLFSGILFCISFLFVIFIKKRVIVVPLTYLLVVLSTTVMGYMLNTIAFVLLIFVLMSLIVTIFMEPAYILCGSSFSLAILVLYAFIFPDLIIAQVGSMMMYIFYIVIYIIGNVNLYILVQNTKRYSKGMEEKAEEAERANESRNLFLTNMSHEIRTPMNAICGMAELTLRDTTLSDEARENTENIRTSGRVLISIVNDILDYSKMESGTMEIIPVTYSFKKMIDEVMEMASVRLDDKELDLRADIQPDLPDMLIGDEVRIRQILFNLLSNAVKYTEKGYVILNIAGTEDGGFIDLTIKVSDSGIGIRKDDIGKLFSSFQQVDSRRAGNNEGTGLGLAICKKLLAVMGGDISVESTYGVGSVFTVHLSQKISDESKSTIAELSEVKQEEDLVTAPEAKVLVVDDNAVNLKVAQGLIRTFGITVDACKSGRECLDILHDTKDYDIIFIDHMMPELDGIDTLNLIRADSSTYMQKVPCIALTANVINGIREMFISEGFDEYIPKPIDMVRLNSVLKKYIPKEKQR